jgi:hypothetical protein
MKTTVYVLTINRGDGSDPDTAVYATEELALRDALKAARDFIEENLDDPAPEDDDEMMEAANDAGFTYLLDAYVVNTS